MARISYDVFVFQPYVMNHSGVLSPAITLDPQYRCLYSKRRDALGSLRQYLKNYVTARKAIFWCAVYDHDILIRHQARDILRWAMNGETADELKMVYPELAG